MERKRKRISLYPERIAGISFGAEDYRRIKEVCSQFDMSESEVVRGTVAKGLGAYETNVHARIEQVALEHGLSESAVVRGAINEGLDEYLRLLRSRKRLEQLRRIQEDLGEDDRDLDLALREYLQRHAEVENLVKEEEFFQMTIERDDEQLEEEDRERQQEVGEFVKRQSKSDKS